MLIKQADDLLRMQFQEIRQMRRMLETTQMIFHHLPEIRHLESKIAQAAITLDINTVRAFNYQYSEKAIKRRHSTS
jgi:hypothetical protein